MKTAGDEGRVEVDLKRKGDDRCERMVVGSNT